MAVNRILTHPCVLVICSILSWAHSQQVNFPPRFRNVPRGTTVEVREDARPGDVIFTVFASDANDQTLTFTVISTDAPFEFDKSTKIYYPITEFYINLTVSQRQPGLDFETRKDYRVILQVEDKIKAVQAVLIVKVLNVNDNSPTLNVYQDSVTINEETSIGTPLNYSMAFFDVDYPDSAYVGLLGDDANLMNINPSTGFITLNSLIDIDPNNEVTIFRPILFASDGALTSTATLTLMVKDINDNTPVCNPSTTQVDVIEEMKGTQVVGILNCTDRDSPLNDNNKLNYTIVQGNKTLFGINNSGAFSVLSPLDYENTKREVVVIRVEDGGKNYHRHTSATVSVTVKPTNDIWPVWGTWVPEVPADLTYSIYENASVGTSVLTVYASDADLDVGNDVTYSMVVIATGGGPQPDAFSLDPITGLLSTHAVLEPDGPQGISRYTVIVQASDGAANSHTINRTINFVIKDINDNAPRFVGVPFPVVILQEEQARTGLLITRVSAADEDLTAANLTFSVGAVLSGNTSSNTWRFSNFLSGQLELAADLDLDIDNSPSAVSVIRLLVKDNGVPELTGTATLTVSLVPDNEFSPTVISQPGATPVQIAEDTPTQTQLTRIEGRDRDKGQEGILMYSIIGGNTGQAFGIDTNGWISIQRALDQDTLSQYFLTVLISDSGVNVRSVTASVTILVTDVNDNSPTCQPELQSVAVPESSTVNTVVASISCTDADTNDVLTATIKSPLNSLFGFNTPKSASRNTTSLWEIKLLQEVDYDSSNQSYTVEIEVSDGKNTISVKVQVSVTAVNEARPTFQTNPTVGVSENVVQNPIFIYQATDTDYSPHDIVSYKINSVSNGGSSLFNIDSKTGRLLLLSALDYETLPAGDKTYKIVVVAEDGGGLTGTGSVTVTVKDANDNPPVCGQSLHFLQVNEKHNGSGPYTVLSDLDCSDQEDGKNLTYMLTQTPGDHFAIADHSIQLKTDSLDYEKSSTHTLTVAVMDSGNPRLTSTVTIYIAVVNQNDGVPVFPTTSPVNISEDVNIGQFVVDVVATDPDGSDSEFGDLQYSIIAGDNQNQFFVDVRSGRVSTRKKLDFETIPVYRLVVQAKEKKGPYSASATQLINVLDVNDEKPICAVTGFFVTVPESAPVNHTVVDLICDDADAGSQLTYTIVSGNTTLFKMDGSSIKLKSQLDYEVAPPSNDLTILVSDSVTIHDVSVSGTVVTGSIDEGPPRFDRKTYTVNVLENQTVYSNIFTLTATDPDSPRDQNGQVKYSFKIPNPLFSIDTTSGQIFLAGMLDREKEATYLLGVIAKDVLGSDSVNVSIVVDDVNDNRPRFRSSVYRGVISKMDAADTPIVTVQATDSDDPQFNNYGTVRYQLSGSSDFKINATSGLITNTVVLGINTATRLYSLTATATDSDGADGALSSTCVVNIQVTTSNKYDPVFVPPNYRVTLQKNQFTIDDIILNVSATDQDSGLDGEFMLNLVSAENKFYLTQTGDTGQVRLHQDLDFDSGDTEFTFEITATDRGSPARSGTCIVTVIVDDSNDNRPLCPQYIYLDKVEGETNLTRIVCSTTNANSTLSYAIISTTPNKIQPAVSSDGILTTSTPLDYELSTNYQILLQIRDNGLPAFITNVTIRLRLIDVNDNDPTFKGVLTFDLPENTTDSNIVLFTVLAGGNDGPTDTITYTLSDMFFHITADTGDIRLIASAPDYETFGDIYTMEVCISDKPSPVVRTSCADITVRILDCNDEPPNFFPAVYQKTVAENEDPVKSLVTVTTVDKDASPRFKMVNYFIKEGNTEGCFRILSSGVIELIKKLDYEGTQNYILVIQATDSVYNTTAQFYVYVSPVNEFAPTFPDSAITVHIEENVPAGTFVFTAAANDSDRGPDGIVRYSIESGPFVIDSQSGRVSVIRSLDRESTPYYNVTVLAVDQGSVARSATLLVTVIIDDVNDHAPTCNDNPYIVSVKETASPGDTLVTLNCIDDDDDPFRLNNALSYVISSTQTDIFTIDQSGHLMLKTGAILDRETETFYNIDVTVSDQGPKQKLTYPVSIRLTVLDVNDNSPFITSPLSTTVPENTLPGTTIETITAEDNDEGVNKQVTYYITGGNTGNVFSLNLNSGDLILNKPLDFESEHQHELQITVRDRGSPARTITGTMTVTVSDVNDNPPNCATPMYTATLKENSANEIVAIVSCDDLDVTGLVIYSITAGNDGNFAVNTNTGTVTTIQNARLNFELVQSYLLEITAFDGVHSDTANIRVTIEDVNEFPPRFVPPGPASVAVPEDADIGFLVYEFKATDQDRGDLVMVFSIVDGNSAQMFFLEAQSGKLQLQRTLDYESDTSYILTVVVQDSGGLNDTKRFHINVTDVNDNTPTCQNHSVSLTIPEAIRLSSVYTPSCSDADKVASPVLEYSLPAGAHQSFSINSNTGQLSIIEPLDYEVETTTWLTILVKEKNILPPRETVINVRIMVEPVNEFNPVFQPSNMYGPYNVLEDIATGTVVAYVTASDADKGLSHGIVRYALTAGDPQGYFWVDEMSGEVLTIRQLNREAFTEYNLTLTARDSIPGSNNSRNASAIVLLIVIDVNDHRPQLVPSFYLLNVSESSAFGPSVVLIHFIVEDKDVGNNSATSIAIVSGNTENKFTISKNDLILSGQLDYETITFYELLLEVTDHGQPPLRSSGRVRVRVLPVNEAAPNIQKASANLTLPENSPLGTLVYDANATDTDNEVHGQITYSIDGESSREFIINSNTGQLFVNAPLDFDVKPNMYTVIIRATDGAGASDPLTSTVSLRISLSDVNDNAPRCSSEVVNMTVLENAPIGTQVGMILATDADSGENGKITYDQTGGSGNKYLTVEPISGIVTTADSIDYESIRILYLLVMAHDGGTPSLTSNCRIQVEVTNINDNDPVIYPQDFVVLVSDKTPVGETILTYSASDLDTTVISAYSLVNLNQRFEIDSTTGAVKTTSRLDREVVKTHILNIQVKDMATQADTTIRTSTATLTIQVDSDDHIIVINGDYNTSVPENIAILEVIFTINATDENGDPLENLVYFIIDGNQDGRFSIDSNGHVQVAETLDRETTPSYVLTIQVSDHWTPPRSSKVKAHITVTDINDNNPTFTQLSYNFIVPENSAMGSSVGTVTALDIDSGANAELTYTFDFFIVGNKNHFSLHPKSGVINAVTSTFNRKIMPTYMAQVKVTDAGSPMRISYTQVNITITDSDYHDPVFRQATYSAILDEESEPATRILQVSADGGTKAEVSYFMDANALDGPTAQQYIQVNETSGVISTASKVNYEEYKIFRVVVLAMTKGSTPLTGNTTVVVNIRDINDNNPVFGTTFFNTEVAYNGACSNLITTVTAADVDAGKNADVSYAFQNQAYSTMFDVGAVSGEVKLSTVAIPNASYRLEIYAKDGGEPTRVCIKPAKLRVDTFVPGNVVVLFRLGISRNAFLAEVDTFLKDLEKVIRTKYPSAVARLWCVVEYEGVAVVPTNSFRRLLADMPVEANVYALRDNLTDSEENFDMDKNFIMQDDLLGFFADNPQGDPNSNVQGAEWDYLNITTVESYHEEESKWFDATHGKIVIILAILLGLILFGIMLCLALRYCCRTPGKKESRNLKSVLSRKEKKQSISNVESDIINIKQMKDAEMSEFQRISQYSSDVSDLKVSLHDLEPLVMVTPTSNKMHLPRFAVTRTPDISGGNAPDILKVQAYMRRGSDGALNPVKKLQTFSSIQDSSTDSILSNPKAMIFTMKRPLSMGSYDNVNGVAYDPLTNMMYQYNINSKEQQWLK